MFTDEEIAQLHVWLGIPPSPVHARAEVQVDAGPSTAPSATSTGLRPPQDRRGQPPLSTDRVQRLVEARELLAGGMAVNAVNARLHVDKVVLRDVFDNNGRLRLSARADELRDWHEWQLVAGLQNLPRALTHADTRTLSDLLRRHAAEPFADLRQAAVEAGMAAQAIDHLFDPGGWLRADRMERLPDDQRQALSRAVERGQAQAAGAGAPSAPLPRSRGTAEAEIERAGRLIGAQAMLAAGQPPKLAAAHAGTDQSWLAKMLDKAGRLVLTAAGQRLIDCPDPALAAQFAALPRSLWSKDLHLLTQVLQQHVAEPMADLREAAGEAGVSPQAVDYLFDDEGSLREDRMASLPQSQRERLQIAQEPADSIRRGPAEVQHARTLADAQALLSSGIASKDVARDLSMHPSTLNKVLDAQGRLLLVPHALRLLECPDPTLAAQFAAVPRALRLRDLRSLAELLRLRGEDAPADLRAAAVQRRMEPQAVAYLFDAEGRLRDDRLATLPDDQRQFLQAAGQPEPPATAPAAPRPARQRPSGRPPEAPAETTAARVDERAPTAVAAADRPVTATVPARASRPAPARAPSSAPGAAAARPAVRPVEQTQRPSTSGRAAPPTHPASQMAGSAEASAVLQFFRRHPEPAQAFHQAQSHFNLGRDALLQLLARAGVTELEARSGRLPEAAQLWQRMRDNLRGEPRATGGLAGQKRAADDAFGSSTSRRPDEPAP